MIVLSDETTDAARHKANDMIAANCQIGSSNMNLR